MAVELIELGQSPEVFEVVFLIALADDIWILEMVLHDLAIYVVRILVRDRISHLLLVGLSFKPFVNVRLVFFALMERARAVRLMIYSLVKGRLDDHFLVMMMVVVCGGLLVMCGCWSLYGLLKLFDGEGGLVKNGMDEGWFHGNYNQS